MFIESELKNPTEDWEHDLITDLYSEQEAAYARLYLPKHPMKVNVRPVYLPPGYSTKSWKEYVTPEMEGHMSKVEIDLEDPQLRTFAATKSKASSSGRPASKRLREDEDEDEDEDDDTGNNGSAPQNSTSLVPPPSQTSAPSPAVSSQPPHPSTESTKSVEHGQDLDIAPFGDEDEEDSMGVEQTPVQDVPGLETGLDHAAGEEWEEMEIEDEPTEKIPGVL